jgi:hypothetical protein
MLLGDFRKKLITQKIIMIAAISFFPMTFMFVSFLLFNDVTVLIMIVIVYFIFATSMGLFMIHMMRKEKIALKGKKVKVISLDYKLDLDVNNKKDKQQFYPKEYYKDKNLNSDLIPLLMIHDEDEIYEIVMISAYYYSIIKNQFGQTYLVHTNNLELIN